MYLLKILLVAALYWTTSYTFRVGETLESVIEKAVDRAFALHEALVVYPTSQVFVDRELDLVGGSIK